MNVAKLSQFLGVGVLAGMVSTGDAGAALTSCSSETGFFDLNQCLDRGTGEVVGQLRGVLVTGTDQFLSFSVGINAGLSSFAINRAEANVRDANGVLLDDCHPVVTAPRGALIFGFGVASAACDTGVSQNILVFYDDEVRL